MPDYCTAGDYNDCAEATAPAAAMATSTADPCDEGSCFIRVLVELLNLVASWRLG